MIAKDSVSRMHAGVVGEFRSAEEAARALEHLQERGYRRIDAWLPYPDERVLHALQAPRTPVAPIMLAGGIAGAAIAYLIMWWTNAVDYPLRVGGKPIHSVPTMIPIVFETTVLLASLAGVVAFVILARLLRLWRPVFDVSGWESASVDRFWVGIDSSDPRFDSERSMQELTEDGAIRVQWVGRHVS